MLLAIAGVERNPGPPRVQIPAAENPAHEHDDVLADVGA